MEAFSFDTTTSLVDVKQEFCDDSSASESSMLIEFEAVIDPFDVHIKTEVKNECPPFDDEIVESSSEKLNTGRLAHNICSNYVYVCLVCCAEFGGKLDLKTHWLTHSLSGCSKNPTSETKFSLEECQGTHEEAQTQERHHRCVVCAVSFRHIWSLKRHMATHSGERQRPHACPTCSARFTERGNLNKHMKSHSGERPHACPTCSFRFSQRAGLKKHMWTHSSERPYACSHCSVKFTERCSLKEHMLTHSGERPYECSTCSAKFARRANLKRHMFTHSDKWPYVCLTCSDRFIQRIHLKIHMLTHSGERPHVCPTCSAWFTARSSLIRHIRLHSNEQPKMRLSKEVVRPSLNVTI